MSDRLDNREAQRMGGTRWVGVIIVALIAIAIIALVSQRYQPTTLEEVGSPTVR